MVATPTDNLFTGSTGGAVVNITNLLLQHHESRDTGILLYLSAYTVDVSVHL